MDIAIQAEIELRDAGYETWPWSGGLVQVICFENEALIGFLHVFPTANSLVNDWEKAQRVALDRHTAPLRSAGTKAWNVYSVFLTSEVSPLLARRVERIEEDFTLARKIARIGVQTNASVVGVLLPLLPIRAQPRLEAMDYEQRLRSRLQDIPPDAVTAFLGSVPAEDVAGILEAES